MVVEFAKIKKVLGERKPTVCLLTHSHYDHIGALNELTEYYGIKVNENHEDEFKYKVLKTPGHTDDSLTFYFYEDNIIFHDKWDPFLPVATIEVTDEVRELAHKAAFKEICRLGKEYALSKKRLSMWPYRIATKISLMLGKEIWK